VSRGQRNGSPRPLISVFKTGIRSASGKNNSFLFHEWIKYNLLNLLNCSCNCICCSCNCICIVFNVCSVSFIVCVVLCAVFSLSVVCYFV
jgi:hypothetical protein